MPQLTRNWYLGSRPAAGDDSDDGGGAVGLASLPGALLDRHGARVLRPGEAAAIARRPGEEPGWARVPRPTAYRARTLLIPGDLLDRPVVVAAIDAALAPAGLRIIPPRPDGSPPRGDGPAAAVLRRLPRITVLVPAAGPVVVDAWTALQTLRAAADAGDPVLDASPRLDQDLVPDQETDPVRLTRDIVRRIALEHLLIGSAITGSPSTEGNGISGSPSTEGNGLTGPGSTDSYVYSGGDTRAPVAVCLPAPRRHPAGQLPCRRPVVAVLDTGVRSHPWLDVRPDPVQRYATEPSGFVAVDWAMQDAIEAASLAAAASGDQPRVPVRGPWDTPVSADPLLGELNDASGHGTFIAGIVRQAAPDARVLAIRIMHSDDVVYEGDLMNALALLAGQIAAAEAGDMAAMVDVVSLSLGYFDESAADVTFSSGLWQVIQLLLELGVAVVAAAGNYSTSRPFYPAAFSLEPGPGPVISVGALNPDLSRALFSNGGRWVWAWAAGAAVVSTFPDDINGSRTPEVRVPPHPANGLPPGSPLPADRAALDPDNYRGGFATWSGTSFAAPLLAAHLAARLLEQQAGPGLGLDEPGATAASGRVTAALAQMQEPG